MRKRGAHRAYNLGVQRGRLVERRVLHVRRVDCALERGGIFDGARDEFRLERFVDVFEGESEKLRVVGRVHEAFGAFFLQKARNISSPVYTTNYSILREEAQLSIFLCYDLMFRFKKCRSSRAQVSWRASVVEA